MKTSEDFKKSVIENGINFWPVRTCSICGYLIGYVFEEDKISFDSNCDCVSYITPAQVSSYNDVAFTYNNLINPETIKETDEFFKF